MATIQQITNNQQGLEARNRINSNFTNLNNAKAEKSYVDAQDAIIQTNINNEATARQNADTALQNSINTINNTTLPTKADKVIGAVNNNFASLDANGNLKDSGKKSSDFETADATILKQANIVNDLTSTSTTQPLGAGQGKALKDLVDTKANQATTYTKTETDTLLNNKVDKEVGKGLSTNDFTNDYKSQLDNAPADINAALAGKKDKITPITPTTKGSASKSATIQVNTQGDVLALSDQDINITASQVSDFNTSAQNAVVEDAINNGVINKSPSENAVFDALTLKQDTITASNGLQKVGVDVQGINASTSAKGVVQLSNTYNGTAEDKATTEKALSDGLALKENAFTKNTAFNKNFGTSANEVLEGNSTFDASRITSGVLDIDRIPNAAKFVYIEVANQAARYALTTAQVQNGDFVYQSDTQVLYFVKDDTNLNNASGYGESNQPVDWSSIQNKPQNIVDIAAINANANDVIQYKSGAFVNRTPAQLKTDLAITATDVSNTPAGNISATNVQDAINELDNEKIALASGSYNAFTNKTTLVDADIISGENSADSFSKIKISTLNLFTYIKNKFGFVKIYYASPSGTSSNNGFSAETAMDFATALSTVGNSGNQICVLPGTYSGNFTLSALNVTISAINNETGGLCNFTGSLTVSNNSSSNRINGLTFSTVNHTGPGNLYLENVRINTALNASGSGYLELKSCDTQGSSLTGVINITGSGNKNFFDRSSIGFLTVNNASVIVNIADSATVAPCTLTAGTLLLQNQYVYSATSTTNAITATGGTLAVANVTTNIPSNLARARISISAGVFYSFSNFNYDQTNSTISGTNLGSNFVFDAITLIGSLKLNSLTASQLVATDANKNLQSLSTSTYPSLTELSYSKGVTSAIQPQLNNKEPTITAGTTSQYWRGDKTWQDLATTIVTEGTNLYFTAARAIASLLTGYTKGAGTVSASDTILEAIQKLDGNADLKAPLASPAFTGDPTAPTQTQGDNSTKLATTEYVDTLGATKQNTLTQADVYTQEKLILQAGSNVTLTTDDTAKTITISSSGGGGGGSFTLSGLSDVSLGTLANNNVLMYSTVVSKWVNNTIATLKSALGLSKSDVGLSNVDNTSDANKPISTATQAALDLKANLVSTPTNNNILITNGSGQPIDSGKTFNDSGTTANDILSALAVNNLITQAQLSQALTYVSCASTSSFSATYNNGSSGVGATLTATAVGALIFDDYAPSLGESVALYNLANPNHQGIYTVTTLGTPSVAGVLTRRSDFDQPEEMTAGRIFVVLYGTTNKGIWATASNVTTVGSNPVLASAQSISLSGVALVPNNFSEYTASASIARANISAAKSGINTDITSLALDQTGLSVKGATANKLTIKPNETLTADRTLNIITGDADRTLNLSNINQANGFVQTDGSNNLPALNGSALTNLNASNISSGSLANERLTNSTITIAGNSTSLGGSITQDAITGLSSNGLIKRTGANTLVPAVAGIDYELPLPSQSGNSGRFLQTNGSALSWASPNLIGAITLWGSDDVPTNYLLCNGATVSRTTYANLFSVIGTRFGIGNGSTTFHLPDMRGLFARGVDFTANRDTNKSTRSAIRSGTFTITGCTTTSGSATITNVSATVNLAPGMSVSGTGIPANSVIQRGTITENSFGIVNINGSAATASSSGSNRTMTFSNATTGNFIGSYQEDRFASHTHTGVYRGRDADDAGTIWGTEMFQYSNFDTNASAGSLIIDPTGDGAETTVKNIYLNYIICFA